MLGGSSVLQAHRGQKAATEIRIAQHRPQLQTRLIIADKQFAGRVDLGCTMAMALRPVLVWDLVDRILKR